MKQIPFLTSGENSSEGAMPKWMNKCERCGEIVGGEHVLLIGADGIVKTMYHIPCFLAANLEPGQLSDVVSAAWGGRMPEYEPGQHRCNCVLVEEPGIPGKRAVLAEDFDSKRWE